MKTSKAKQMTAGDDNMMEKSSETVLTNGQQKQHSTEVFSTKFAFFRCYYKLSRRQTDKDRKKKKAKWSY